MKSFLRQDGNKAKNIAVAAMFSAVLIVCQVSLAFLPNIELVSLLVILISRHMGKNALLSIYVFVLAEMMMFGAGLWVLNYLYIWLLLWALTQLLCTIKIYSYFSVIILCTAFGLFYGALCAIPYIFIGGFSFAFAYWASGVPFDLLHAAGNLATAICLFIPLDRLFSKSINLGGNNGR